MTDETILDNLFTENLVIVENSSGGKQSDVASRFDLIPTVALVGAARVLDHGAKKYGEENWREIECRDHINHAIRHLYAYLCPHANTTTAQKTDDLTHALVRIMFAVETAYTDGEI